jgi:tRNA(Ile)-lysidine synthase
MQKFDKFKFSNALLHRVAKYVQTENLIQPEDSVLAGVSGGADSVTLLHILKVLQPYMFRSLGVAHLNHCIRSSESDRDAEFVSNLCGSLNIPFHGSKKDVGLYAYKNKLNLEEAARKCRYDFFHTLIQKEGYTKIALGHQANDNAELVLMHLFRGSGLKGVSGMPANRDNKVIRPLLKVTLPEIMDYISSHRLMHVYDATNFDITLTRNRIRHRLIPMLQNEFNPKIVKALNTFSTVSQDEDEWMSQITESFFLKILLERKTGEITLAVNELCKAHRALARRALRRALIELKGDLRRIYLAHIESILDLLSSQKGYQRLNLPEKILVERVYDQLQFKLLTSGSSLFKGDQSFKHPTHFFKYLAPRPKDGPIKIYISEIDCSIEFSITHQDITTILDQAGHNIAFFDMDRLVFPLIIRNTRPGDRYAPLGMGGTQKLKDYFINTKVPHTQRKYVPILLSQDRIIWIAGHRLSRLSRIRSDTKRILKAKFSCLKRSND